MRSTRIGAPSLSSTLRGVCLAGGLTLALAGGALTGAAALPALASATPIALDVPNNGAAPMIAFDQVTQNTFIAWTDPQSTPNGGIDVCVLLKDTSTCEGGGPVLLAVTPAENPAIHGSNTISLGGITVLPNGDVVVIGTPVSTGSITWESPGDGSAFLTSGHGLQNGGGFISPVSLFYTPGNVVALGNTDIGLLDDYGNFFSDSPFAGPEYPSSLPKSNTNPPPAGGDSVVYPRKALGTNGPEVAAEPLPAPAAAGSDIVVGVGDNFAGPNVQLSDCVNGDNVGTGYGVDVGLVGASSSAGYLNAQDSAHDSIPAYTGLACNAENPVVASPEGGTQGIGVLENEGDGLDGGTNYTLDYRSFDLNSNATGGSFGGAALVANLTGAAGEVDVVDDSSDGVYAMWSSDGLHVNYSSDGGAVWGVPVEIPQPASGEIDDPVITGIGGGAFLLAYEDNLGSGTQTFVEAFSYQVLEQAPTAISTIQTSGTTSGAEITIPAGTVGESDTATITGLNASLATGTVDFALYNNSSCTGTPVFAGAAEAADGAAAIADDSSTGLAPGEYYWKAAYTGNTTNAPSVSSCGSEVLNVVPASVITGPPSSTAPTSNYTVKSVTDNSNGTVTIVFVPTESGEAEVVVTVPTASIASASAVAAKAKKCKKEQIKVKGKCLPKNTVSGKASGDGTAGVPLKLTVNLSSKIKALLKQGKTVHLTATLTYKSVRGGTATVQTFHLTDKGKKPAHHKG
jgi:hypothetical protein